jgi:hypothetical protein
MRGVWGMGENRRRLASRRAPARDAIGRDALFWPRGGRIDRILILKTGTLQLTA